MKRKAGKAVVGAKPLPPPKGGGSPAAKGKGHRKKVRGRGRQRPEEYLRVSGVVSWYPGRP